MKQDEYLFSATRESAYSAAKRVVPHILRLFKSPPATAVDLGGGLGGWCRAFMDQGITKAVRIDHPSIRRQDLQVSEDCFLPHDLDAGLEPVGRFDLAISIEFAEHVKPDRSEWVVDFLTRSADVVVFSAAIPRQGGLGHLNERWPWYWDARFKARGFAMFDYLRPLLMPDLAIPYWLRQNLRVFVKAEQAGAVFTPGLRECVANDFALVHASIVERPFGLRESAELFCRALKRALSSRSNRRKS